MSAWKIGIVDGLVFMAIWGTVLVMVTPLQFWAVGCASLLPVVLVVAALGRLQAIELKNEKLSLLQASVGGAKWGAIISAIFVAVVLAFDSHAAGGHLDGQPFLVGQRCSTSSFLARQPFLWVALQEQRMQRLSISLIIY